MMQLDILSDTLLRHFQRLSYETRQYIHGLQYTGAIITLHTKNISTNFCHFCFRQRLLLRVANFTTFIYVYVLKWRGSQVAEIKVADLSDKPESVNPFMS